MWVSKPKLKKKGVRSNFHFTGGSFDKYWIVIDVSEKKKKKSFSNLGKKIGFKLIFVKMVKHIANF